MTTNNISNTEQGAPSPFVHLHVHSMYSLSDALGDPEDIILHAKSLGYDAIALTDHNALYAAVEFYEAGKKHGIKTIIGVEVNVAKNSYLDKRPGIDNHTTHLTLLAETNEGYHNLLKLVSISFLEGFYYKPRVDKQLLKTYHEGIIGLSGCLKGELPRAIQSRDTEQAKKLVGEFLDIFGKEHFFIELVHHPESPTQNDVNEGLIALSKQLNVPVVATKDVHYLTEEYREAQDVLCCIHDGKILDDPNRATMSSLDLSMSTPDAMVSAFSDLPEAIHNTRLIADRCNVVIQLGVNHLPKFDVPEGETEFSYLSTLCEHGLEERYGATEQYEMAKERLAFELATIERMGFAAYFLIVADYINWAKDHDVIVGPGRGSAAGSIVAYALKITNLDPLRYGLLFERFLNPDRISMPDIDTDFDDVKRKDVIEYVTQKYGADRVAGIITFGTMAARAAVRDVGRVLNMSYGDVDRVAKAIPPPQQGRHIPLETSKEEAPELKEMYQSDHRVKRLIDLAIKLEGTTRHASQHACGIVIAPKALNELSPLQKAQGGDVDQVVQYANHSAEVTGLLKMDFLGLSNLSIIRDCLEITEAVYGDVIDINTLPLDDPKTFELLGNGETTGVFQLESDGMKKYIRELKPNVIEDIIAMVALYRPGPMQFIESFIDRKHGREKVSFMHELTKSALQNTYGIPVYQEQVMQVAKDMAGFTPGEADTLRKAMGKKIAKLMAELRIKFIEGSVKNGVEQKTAEAIFTQFEEFAAYGFNKSHAACYALIAYQTAYLKAHYPDAFMAALLNSDINNIDRITIEVEECKRMNLPVLPPDVNESYARFAVVKDKQSLRFGLAAVKGLGEDIAETIIKERKKNGVYKDLEDFITRVQGSGFNRRSLEALIKAGALDRFGDRNQLYFNIEIILQFQKRTAQEASSGQFNLFALSEATASKDKLVLKPAPPAQNREILQWEKELLGLYLSSHPFKEFADKLQSLIVPIKVLETKKAEKSVRIGGLFTIAKKILTKAGEPMVFAKLEDMTGDIEAVIFPRTYKEKPELWNVDTAVILHGRVQEKDGELKFLVESGYALTPDSIDEIIRHLHQYQATIQPTATPTQEAPAAKQGIRSEQAISMYLRAHLPPSILHKIRELFDQHPGRYHVYFEVDHAGHRQRILSSYRIRFDDLLQKELELILGPDTVKVIVKEESVL